jgi:death-on-curing protein
MATNVFAHAALEVTLFLNGIQIVAPVDKQEQIMLSIASGEITREEFARWLEQYVRALSA